MKPRTTRRGWTAALRALQLNDSHTFHIGFEDRHKIQMRLHAIARQIGIKIVTEKYNPGEIFVERLE